MTPDIPEDLYDFLEKCVSGKLDNFQVEIEEGNENADGLLGDLMFISLTNKKTDEALHLAVKQALVCDTEDSFKFVNEVFHNEIWFYETVWPQLKSFHDDFPDVDKLKNIPKLYATEKNARWAEKIALENLKYLDFKMPVKTEFLKKEQLEYVLRMYGRFHAVSMAFRETYPEKFREITEPLNDIHVVMAEMRFFQRAIHQCCRNILSTFDEEADKEIVEKFKVYAEKGSDIFKESSQYKGKNRTSLHGDCWSNNMMFKYDEFGNIEDMKIIDFQMNKVGTVVTDLSYCIYGNCSKDILDDLDYYLRVYHQSLSESLRGYKLDPEIVYPYDALKEEWKQHSKFGFIFGILCYSGKFIEKDPQIAPVFSEMIDNDEKRDIDEINIFSNNSDKFLSIGRNLVLHMYEQDFF